MEKKMSMCGFNCATCIIYIETKNNDLDEIRRLMYNADESETIETLGCLGCSDKNNKNKFCNMCLIRKCAIQKDLDSCGKCDNFPCNKLSNNSNSSLEVLEEINKEYKNNKL